MALNKVPMADVSYMEHGCQKPVVNLNAVCDDSMSNRIGRNCIWE